MITLTIKTTQKDEVIDITDEIEKQLKSVHIDTGCCLVFSNHTTCCLTTADLDPGTDLDMLESLRGLLPEMCYRHPHDPAHASDHILSSLVGPSVVAPFFHKQLVLGKWQRIVLVELDGPRERTLKLTFVKEEL